MSRRDYLAHTIITLLCTVLTLKPTVTQDNGAIKLAIATRK